MSKYDEALGAIIKRERLSRGWTLQRIAEQLRVTRQTIFYYENGSRGMSIETFFKFCDIYNLDPETIRKEVMK